MPVKTITVPSGVKVRNLANGVDSIYSDAVEITFDEPVETKTKSKPKPDPATPPADDK